MRKWFNISVCCFLSLILTGFASLLPSPTGLKDGKLQPCPDAPHCVSTESTKAGQHIDPLPYPADLEREILRGKLLAHIKPMKRAHIVSETENYVYFQVTSLLVRYKDDVEVYFDDATRTIHFRSASRYGYYDFGVNRRRIEELKKIF